MSQILGEEVETSEAQSHVVAATGSGFGWDASALWVPEETQLDAPVLRRAAVWHGPEAVRHVREIGTEACPVVRNAVGAKTFSVEGWPTAALPGGEPTRVTTVAVPIRIDGETLGVFQFVSRDAIHVDRGLGEAFTTLGRQMGQYLRRRRVRRNCATARP